MLSVSIVTNYINIFNEVDWLRESLCTWADQAQPPLEILLADSSKPGLEQDAVRDLCAKLGVIFVECPFNHYSSYTARNINALVERAKGDAILWLCPMWRFRERTWIERMAKRLEEYGPNHILGTDNDRRNIPMTANGPPVDWFVNKPDIFEAPDGSYLDNPKMMFYRSIWIPMDTDFDPPPDNDPQRCANAHGVVYWAWQQINQQGRKVLLCRDFKMEHAPYRKFPGALLEQVYWSERIMRRKGL